MAIQWADDFSRYGTGDESRTAMLDGLPYAALGSFTEVRVDPDPNAEGAKRALNVENTSNDWTSDCRIALPSVVSGKLGGCFRAWLGQLPTTSSDRPALFQTLRANGNLLSYMRIEQNGAIQIVGRVSDVLTVLADSVNPIVSPNSWNHYEYIHDKAAGTVRLYVNGILRLTATGIDTADNITIVNFSHRNGSNNGVPVYIKDLVLWDGTGSFNNDVMGTVIVGRLKPNADIGLGDWINNVSTNGWRSLSNAVPYNRATISGNVGTSTFRVANVYYQYTDGSVNAGSPAGTASNPWLLRRNTGNTAETAETLFKAINASGIPGTDYSSGLVANPDVRAGLRNGNIVEIVSLDGVTTTYNFTTTGGLAWANTSSMLVNSNTVQDSSFLSTGIPPSSAMSFEFENLPDDVTSVRGLIMVSRHKKSDGGDANIQTAISPNGTDWDNGADRPITTAFQYDFDVSEASPATSVSWTPVEVNNLKGRVTRTL